MRFGFSIRLMGEAAVGPILRTSAERAEAAGLDTLWVPDHIAIPPDETEGSGGRYLDPLSSLAWLAAATQRIRLGTGVLILPYRPALPTAKVIATIQELSEDRLELGVGIGWMEAEFRAVGVDRRDRGPVSDETLRFFHDAFDAEDDVVVSNGQPFVFRPRPGKPRIWVGGAGPHALDRTARFGDGWIAMTDDPERLAESASSLRQRFSDLGRTDPEIAVFGALGLRDENEDLDRLAALEALGVTEFIQGARYGDLDGFQLALDRLVERRTAYLQR